MKILSVIGTRPEVIKLAPIIRELGTRRELQNVVCVTAQHREMLDSALELFKIRPDYDLDVMAENQTPAQVASAILAKLDPILQKEQPDWVLVQGDTTTTAAAALGAFYRRVRVGHVEAGLRTFDKWHPFPEEINRRVTSAIGDLHFAPTACAKQNLMREGVAQETIAVTGNPVIDALEWVAQLAPTPEVEELFSRLDLIGRRLILVTAHRRENWGRPLENICSALREIAAARPGVTIVYPVHLNPNINEPVHRLLDGVPNIVLLPPVDYLTTVHLMRQAWIVVTDSGGIQEEAPSLGKPVLVLRQVTERPEAVEAGAVKVIGTEQQAIVNEISRLLDDSVERERMARAVNPYGDGHASGRIVAAILGEPFLPFEGAEHIGLVNGNCDSEQVVCDSTV
ncbi:MAG TPA: UDP-N-acetylglucosamine 2-epimerase (non-hydrolyzing) [Pyrinomonadaceae bacterium]|nr:UDP-N-acetylglucosamine 2-epimerase (non-hydrolyzing) [Pyrinomonadaceae bacterium]